MPKYFIRRLMTAVLAIFLVAGFLLVDSNAQKRRRRSTRRRPTAPRITNPDIYQPSTDNSNTNTTDTTGVDTQPARPTGDQDPEAMKKTIHTLSTQVDKLSDKLTQMEESQRSLVDLERLSRAEARSTALRAELRDVQAKEADLEAKAEEIDYALKPENIERATAGYGTTHPEEVREQRRRQLENEKQRVRKQLEQLAASRTHLDEAIATSDAEVERLRKKLDAADEASIQNAKTKAQSEGSTTSAPRPTPTPTP